MEARGKDLDGRRRIQGVTKRKGPGAVRQLGVEPSDPGPRKWKTYRGSEVASSNAPAAHAGFYSPVMWADGSGCVWS